MFEIPRRRQAANNDAAASMRIPYLGLGAAFAGQVVTSGGGADTFHDVVPIQVNGSMVLGGSIPLDMSSPNVRVLVLGPARPTGSNLIARRVDGEWVADRLHSSQVISICDCPSIPNTIHGGSIYYGGYVPNLTCLIYSFPDAVYEPNGTFTYPDNYFNLTKVLTYTGPLWRTPTFKVVPDALVSGSIVIVCNGLKPGILFSTKGGEPFEYYNLGPTTNYNGTYQGDCPIPKGSCYFYQIIDITVIFWYNPK